MPLPVDSCVVLTAHSADRKHARRITGEKKWQTANGRRQLCYKLRTPVLNFSLIHNGRIITDISEKLWNRFLCKAHSSVIALYGNVVNVLRSAEQTDRHSTSVFTDRHRTSLLTDRHRTSLLTDRHRTSSLTDRHRTSSLTDRHRTSLLTDKHRTSSLTDRHRTSLLTDRHRTSSLTDRHRTSLLTDRHRTSSLTDRRRTSLLTDRHRTSISHIIKTSLVS